MFKMIYSISNYYLFQYFKYRCEAERVMIFMLNKNRLVGVEAFHLSDTIGSGCIKFDSDDKSILSEVRCNIIIRYTTIFRYISVCNQLRLRKLLRKFLLQKSFKTSTQKVYVCVWNNKLNFKIVYKLISCSFPL